MMILAILAAAQTLPPGETCADAKDQSTMTRCAWEDFRRADAELNREWPKALGQSRAMDGDNPMPDVPTYTAVLVRAQNAWIAHRDAECAVAGQEMRGGSGEPMLVGHCRARMTRERIAYLKGVNR